MKLVQLFDALGMPEGLHEDFTLEFEQGCDKYIRWYPHRTWGDKRRLKLREQVNEWLKSNGMQADGEDELFFVLIHVNN